jgi:hypothetical protein
VKSFKTMYKGYLIDLQKNGNIWVFMGNSCICETYIYA